MIHNAIESSFGKKGKELSFEVFHKDGRLKILSDASLVSNSKFLLLTLHTKLIKNTIKPNL